MPFQKGYSSRWLGHDTVNVDLMSMNIALQLALPHDDTTRMLHPGPIANLEYNVVMKKQHRRDVVQAIIDKIEMICIIARHCPSLRPVTTDMTDCMYNVMSNATAKRILSNAGLAMNMETARFFGSKLMLLLYATRALCARDREFKDMLNHVKILEHDTRTFQVVMLTNDKRETVKWTIQKFMESLQAQLKIHGPPKQHILKLLKEEVEQEDKQEGKKEDKEEMVKLDADGYPMWPCEHEQPQVRPRRQDGHDAELMDKATKLAATACLARAGDQRLATELR